MSGRGERTAALGALLLLLPGAIAQALARGAGATVEEKQTIVAYYISRAKDGLAAAGIPDS